MDGLEVLGALSRQREDEQGAEEKRVVAGALDGV